MICKSDDVLKDYISYILDLFNPFEFIQVIEGLNNLTFDDLVGEYKELIGIYNNREEIFASLSEYDNAFYTGYIETTLAMALVPVKLNKVNKLKVKKETDTFKKIKELEQTKNEVIGMGLRVGKGNKGASWEIGTKVKTPNKFKEEFTPGKVNGAQNGGNVFIDNMTGDIWSKSHTDHTGDMWKRWPKGTKNFSPSASKKSGVRRSIRADGTISSY